MQKKLQRYFECEAIKKEEEKFDANVNRMMKMIRKYKKDGDIDLTEEQKREIDEFWKKYEFAFKPNYDTFKIYMNRTGKFDPRYLPHGIRQSFLSHYLSDENYRVAFQNKAYLSKIYHNIKQPVIVIRKIEGIYYDKDYQQISLEEAVDICEERLKEVEIVIKPSGLSGGKGVVFLKKATKEQLKEEFKKIPKLMVVQEAIKQHLFMASLNPSTVNTVRLTTYLNKWEIIPLAALVKIGNAEVRVDNYKHGGHILGLHLDGTSLPYALNVNMERVTQLPTGIDLSKGITIPGFDNVIETAKKAHIQTPKMKIVSWDIAIDESGEAVIIEANYGGDMRMHQATTGPIFGDMTEEVLDQYVLKKFSRLRANREYNYKEFFDHIVIVKYAGFQKKVKVPETIHGKPVTSIGEDTFSGCEEITEIILPNSIKRIYDRAFYGCKNLVSINVPKSLTHFGKYCFYSCKRLDRKIKDSFKEKVKKS